MRISNIPGLYHCLASNSGIWVLGKQGIENGIRNLIGHFVRVAFGYGLRSKDGVIAHEHLDLGKERGCY